MTYLLLLVYWTTLFSTNLQTNPIPIPICSAKNWHSYLWNDESHLLVFLSKPTRKEKTYLLPMDIPIVSLELWNPTSKSRRKLSALTKLWKQYDQSNLNGLIYYDMSHGKLVAVFHPFGIGLGGARVLIYDLNTNHYLSASLVLSYVDMAFWDDTGAEVVGIDYDAKPPKAYFVDFLGETFRESCMPKDTPRLIGLTPGRSGVGIETRRGEGNWRITISNFELNENARIIHQPLSPTPPQFDAFDYLLSPNGGRILWVFKNKLDKERLEILVWVSDSKGEGMRPIGTYISSLKRRPKDVSPYPVIRCFQWLPDSRAVSFIQEDTLYKIPTL